MTTRTTTHRLLLAVSGAALAAIALAGCVPLGIVNAISEGQSHQVSSGGSPSPDAGSDGGSGSDSAADQNAALDAYVAAAQPQMTQIAHENADVYTDVSLTAVHPGTLEYDYTYKKQIDPAATADYFDGHLSDFQDTLDAEVFPSMKQAGITSEQSVLYVYYNADGTEIWSHTFVPTS